MKSTTFEKFLFWFIAIAFFVASFCISHVALGQNSDVGTVSNVATDPTMENIFKYGGTITVSGLLLIGMYYLFKYLQDYQKQAKENERLLEQRIVNLEGEKTVLSREHIAMLEKQNDKFVALIKESQQYNDKLLEKYLLESKENRLFMANEYEKQRLFYEKIYSEMVSRYNTNK